MSKKQPSTTKTIARLQQALATQDRRMRMIWNSNSPWSNSGYGAHMRDLMYRFLADGWPTAMSCFYGLEGSPIAVNGLLCYPKMADTWGTDGMYFHGKHFGSNVIFTMQDIWPLDQNVLGKLNQEKIPWIPYVPIDQEPVPPNVLDKLRFAYKIITFSEFGQRALEKKGFTSTLIREGIDPEIFQPLDRAECRKIFNLPADKFIVGMVGANKDNPPRKGWQEALEAFKLFHTSHPESIFFYQTNQPMPTGFPVQDYAKMLGIEGAVFHLDEYTSIFHIGGQQMAQLYNCFDILISPSITEGFSLCPVEAMACGTPVIVNNCTSQPELVIEGVTGEICQTARKHLSAAMGFFYFADVNSLVEKMEKLYTADRVKMGVAARAHVLDKYNINKIFKEQWVPLLVELQSELLPPLQPITDPLKLDQLNK